MDAIIVWLILATFSFQILFILFGTLNLSKYTDQPFREKPTEAISVIICAHNELDQLKANLDLVLSQEYPNFEVILVDDASSDGSIEFLYQKEKEFNHLKIVSILSNEKITNGKKQALIRGLREASNEIVVLSDADCKPLSRHWIAKMSSSFMMETEIVLGYSPVLTGKGLLAFLARYENLLTASLYLNFAIKGFPYMGVGRNLAYRKKLLINNLNIIDLSIAGGDDDLLVNQLANKSNTRICVDKESWIETFPPVSWKAYYNQKRRHLSVSGRYKLPSAIILFSWNFTKLLGYLFVFLILINVLTVDNKVWLVFAAYLSVLYIGAIKNTKVLGNRQLLFLLPFLDVLSVFFNSFVVLRNLFSRKSEWK